jgi:ABC-2 type transport system permease protein
MAAKPVPRLLRLWHLHVRMNVIWMTRDFRSFITYFLSDMVAGVAGVTAILLLAERFDGIGTWSKFQVVFLLGYAAVIRGLLNSLFGLNILFISRRLGRGQLDHVLLQPQPVATTLLTEGFTPFDGAASLLPGLLLMGWAAGELALPVTPQWLLLLAADLLASGGVVLSFSFLWGSLAFWAPRAAEEVSSSAIHMVDQLRSFPLDGVGPLLLAGFLTVLPVGFVAWHPCRSLLGLDTSPGAAGLTLLASVLLGALAAWVFRRGMRHYGRTGSQRYSSFGHRR